MRMRTALDLGLVIRDKRRKLKLSQAELARKAGDGRQWIFAIEHGKSVPNWAWLSAPFPRWTSR